MKQIMFAQCVVILWRIGARSFDSNYTAKEEIWELSLCSIERIWKNENDFALELHRTGEITVIRARSVWVLQLSRPCLEVERDYKCNSEKKRIMQIAQNYKRLKREDPYLY